MPEFSARVLMNSRVRHLDEFVQPTLRMIREATKTGDTEFRRQQSQLFSSSGASGGDRWAPLSERYRKRKERIKPGRPILTFSGRMRRKFTHRSNRDHIAKGFRSARTWKIHLGARSKLATYHGPDPRFRNQNLPVRDPMQRTQRQELRLLIAVRTGLARFMNQRNVRIAAQAKRFFRVA